MITRGSARRLLVLGGIAAVAIVVAFAPQSDLRAQDEAPGIVVGTYDPQQVAVQAGVQAQMTEQMEGLQQRMQAAQQAGNQEEIQRIQAAAQQIQDNVVAEFENNVNAALPAVAQEAGAQVIAIEVSYAAPGIETRDLTTDIATHLNRDNE
jgi:hypothetical protein